MPPERKPRKTPENKPSTGDFLSMADALVGALGELSQAQPSPKRDAGKAFEGLTGIGGLFTVEWRAVLVISDEGIAELARRARALEHLEVWQFMTAVHFAKAIERECRHRLVDALGEVLREKGDEAKARERTERAVARAAKRAGKRRAKGVRKAGKSSRAG